MNEPSVALTDFGLAILCGWFAFSLSRQSPTAYRKLWIVFFASICLSSLAGGLVHGFFTTETSPVSQLLWLVTLLAIGVTTASVWVLAGHAFTEGRRTGPFIILSVFFYIIYAIILILFSQAFLIAIIGYIPATTAWFFASLFAYFRDRAQPHIWICTGIIITFIAAAVQQLRIGIHPVYFTHNALYHLLQAIGLVLFFTAAKRLGSTHRISR